MICSLAAIVFTLHDRWVCVLHQEEVLLLPANQYEEITEKLKYILSSLKWIYHDKYQ